MLITSGSVLTQQELVPILKEHERFVMSTGGTPAELRRCKLAGLNFANRNLSGADFAGALLVGATLYGSDLERACFYGADLRFCNLRYANLARADMRGACFRGANLSDAILDGADIRAARMGAIDGDDSATHNNRGGPASPKLAAITTLEGVDFSNASLKNVSFSNARFENANFTGAILEGAQFKGAKLSKVRFNRAILTGVNLKELGVPAEALRDCVLDVSPEAQAKSSGLEIVLASHEEWIATEGKKGSSAVLDREDLRPLQNSLAGRKLVAMSAQRAIAIGVNFAGSRLQASKFDDADLRSADFSDCDLRGVRFRNAQLSHAKFTRARLGKIKLEDGSEIATTFECAATTAYQFDDAILECGIAELGIPSPVMSKPS